MAKTIAEELVDTLTTAGVKRIYGIVGDSLNPVTDALRRRKKIDWVHVRHEETAAFAAGAEAQLTGQLAVCAGSCGPGNLHLINGLYDAHRSMAPVLAIAAHIPSSEIGSGYFQETHPDQLFRECSHYCELISNPRQMPRVLQTAVQHAVTKKGVSVVILSGDVADMTVEGNGGSIEFVTNAPVVRPSDADLGRLAELLNKARKVAIFCGSGCAGADGEVLALAEKIAAPVGYSFRGKEWVEHNNPNAVGMTGLLGWGSAYHAMHGCDVLLLLGTDFPYDAFMPSSPKIAQVDIRPERLGRRSKLDLGLCGDVADTLRALLPHLRAKSDRGFLDAMLEKRAVAERKLRTYVDEISQRKPIHPESVAATVDELAGEDAVFTVDTGMCCVWGARYLRGPEPADPGFVQSRFHGQCLAPGDRRQMAYPDRPVISFSGDGGLSMLMGELLTVAQYELPIRIVVFNNHRLGMVQLEMEAAAIPHFGCELKNPNFAAVAQAIGLEGIRVEDPDDVRPALQRAMKHDGPVLVDVVTDPDVLSMPPKATVKQAKGFALAMTKMAFAGEVDDVLDTVMANWRVLK